MKQFARRAMDLWVSIVIVALCGIAPALACDGGTRSETDTGGFPQPHDRVPTSIRLKVFGYAPWHNAAGARVAGDGAAAWCDMSVVFPNMYTDSLVYQGFRAGPLAAGRDIIMRARRLGEDPAVFPAVIIVRHGVVISETYLVGDSYAALTSAWRLSHLRLYSDVPDLSECSVVLTVAASGLASSRVEIDALWAQ